MSNLILNIRIGLWHLHIIRDSPWVRISRNDFHRGLPYGWFSFDWHGL